jgi:hypothetical protein
VLGPVDEALIVQVIATGASAEELAKAWAWVNGDEALVKDGRPPPVGKVAKLIDLLSPEEGES